MRGVAPRSGRGGWLVLLALLAGMTVVGFALAQGMGGAPGSGGYGYGPGMMGNGYGHGFGDGPGGMPGYGRGGMGGYGMMAGTGMMQVLPSDAAPLDDATVRAALQRAADGVTPGATLHDIMVFTNNVYAQVLDAQGNAVGEILLDRYSGAVSPEPGPNMMWNTRSWMGGPGMRGGSGGMGGSGSAGTPRYDEAAARARADAFLAGYLPGATAMGSQTFPGYYTFDYGMDGAAKGMLSVNATTGQIWPHTWHGVFIREME